MSTLFRLDLSAPHQIYRTRDGIKRPGMTTVLGVYGKDGLLPWYADMEREGIWQSMGLGQWSAEELKKVHPRTKEGKFACYAVLHRDKAADLGDVVHAHNQAWLNGGMLDPDGIDPTMYADALIPHDRFRAWVRESGCTLICTEHMMVSERWKIGGTGDAFFRAPDGLVEYWDTKTTKPWKDGIPYDEVIAQSAGYAEMYHEETGERVARIRIARTGKTVADVGTLYPMSDGERRIGVGLVETAIAAYNLKQELKNLR